MTITFEAKPIETAPTDLELMLFCPARGWRKGLWEGQSHCIRPKPYWKTWGSEVAMDRNDQPTHWAEISEMAVQP